MSVPDSPQNFALTSESKIAVGENATVKWDAMPSAASYTVTVYKDNKFGGRRCCDKRQQIAERE